MRKLLDHIAYILIFFPFKNNSLPYGVSFVEFQLKFNQGQVLGGLSLLP